MKINSQPIAVKTTQLYENVKSLPINSDMWIAGGTARRLFEGMENDFTRNADIDCFFKTTDALTEFKTKIQSLTPTKKRFLWDGTRYQLVSKIFSDINDLFNSFDFTICQFATDGNQILYTEQAIDDLRARIIRPIPSRLSYAHTKKRIEKYIHYGFHMAPETIKWLLAFERRSYFPTKIFTGFSMPRTNLLYSDIEQDPIFNTGVNEPYDD